MSFFLLNNLTLFSQCLLLQPNVIKGSKRVVTITSVIITEIRLNSVYVTNKTQSETK